MTDLVLKPNSLVFYTDDTGDERFGDEKHPIFAFGGVACVTQDHLELARTWQAMKATHFPQVRGPLHAKRHLRDRLPANKKATVLASIPPDRIGRFGLVLTSRTAVPLQRVVETALKTLGKRFSEIARGLIESGLWQPPGPVIAIFEQSTRLARQIELHFDDKLVINNYVLDVEGCFMPKSTANPFLEMADVVVNALGKNIRHQAKYGRSSCTSDFQILFRDVGPPMARYIEVTEVIARHDVHIHGEPSGAA